MTVAVSHTRLVRLVAAAAGLHFVAALVSAVIARGLDMDQLTSRSVASRAGARVHDVLMAPHDVVMRAMPLEWLPRYPLVIPAALILNSLAWGVVLAAAWRTLRRQDAT